MGQKESFAPRAPESLTSVDHELSSDHARQPEASHWLPAEFCSRGTERSSPRGHHDAGIGEQKGLWIVGDVWYARFQEHGVRCALNTTSYSSFGGSLF
jgi:hypothetical protein